MSEVPPSASPPFVQQWAKGLAALGILGAVTVLISWFTDSWEWLALGARGVPIAPGTAILALLVGTGLWVRAHDPKRVPWLASILGAIAILLSAVIIVARLRGVPLAVEGFLAGTIEERGGVPLGRVSEYTAVLFVLLGSSLAIPSDRARGRQAVAFLASSASAVAVLVLHGYVIGVSLVTEGSAIPVAATTALLVLALGASTVLLSGTDVWPLRVFFTEGSLTMAKPDRRSFAVFSALVAGFVLTSGFFWYRVEHERALRRSLQLHEVVAELKAQEISHWFATHLALTRSLGATAVVGNEFRALTRDASAARLTARSIQWIAAVQSASETESISLYASDGRLLTVAPESLRTAPALELERVLRLPEQGGVLIDESVLGSDQRLTLWVPLGEPRSARPRGWVAVSLNIRRELLPLLATLPVLGPSAETVLWRRDGETAESITDLDLSGATPAPARVALDAESSNPIVRAFRGERGVVGGTDFRGTPVVAVVRAVDGTDWLLIVKSDRAALTAPLFARAVRSIISSVTLVLALSIAIFALWYRRDLVSTRRELELMRGHDSDLARLTQLDRMLRMRSATDVAVVRAREEQELFQAACDAAVNAGGYRMAWVGLAEHDVGRTVRPVAVSGEEHGYLAKVRVTWSADDPDGLGPTGLAIRTGALQAAQDLQRESNYAPWSETAREHGYASSVAIPLKVHGEVVGALSVYSEAPFAFHDEEVSLLGDVGDDLSFGLTALRDRRTHQERETQLSFFREVMERSNDAIYVMDATSGEFIDFNQTALRTLGYTAEELRARHPKDIAPDIVDDGAERRRFDQVLQGEVTTRRAINRRKDGTTFPVEMSLTALEMAGRRLVLSITRDITDRVREEAERERLQAQFLRAQRMESVGRLAGGVAHDFNNLLTVINGTADLAMADLPADSPARADLADIRAAGTRAAILTRQLLAFSRQQVLRPEHLDLNEVVPAFLGMLKRVIGEDIAVEVRLGSAAAHVVADHGQLEQVLMNLCVNARDAMPTGGRLTLEVEVCEVNEAQASQIPTMTAGRFVRLSVADTGEGMGPDVQARLFEPFFTTKEAGRGTGLGLSTVYGIVKQSGGYIGLVSSLGHGAKFSIYLPVSSAGAGAEPAVTRTKPSAGSETILVVEDEEAIRFVVRRVLERSGYKVLEAPTGADALTVIRAHDGPLDLVMTDLMMPGMSGIELARTLRREHPALRILLASGYSQETVSSEFDTAREWQLISKPYALKDLLSEIRRVLDSPEPPSAKSTA